MGNAQNLVETIIEDPVLASEELLWEDRPWPAQTVASSCSIAIIAHIIVQNISQEETALDVLSFNIPTKGPNFINDAWKHRKNQIASLVQHYEPSIVCFQEPHQSQTQDLAALLTGTLIYF